MGLWESWYLAKELSVTFDAFFDFYFLQIKKETIDLLETSIIKLCREGSVKLGLF